jgi:arginyl-tRNA--protein-N-Asp/Glu arginylyltransferase
LGEGSMWSKEFKMNESCTMASLNSTSTASMMTIELCGTSTGPCGYCSGCWAHLTHFSNPNCSQAYRVVRCFLHVPRLKQNVVESRMVSFRMHIYKPINWNSCCPALSIRLDTTKFQPTKSQRQEVVTKLEWALNGNVTS